MTSYLDQLKVRRSSSAGQIEVTVTLPPEHLQDYVKLLQSLSGLLQYAKRQAHYQEIRSEALSQERAIEAQEQIQQYRADLVQRYDSYLDQGLGRKEAIKQISQDLKTENHPWYYVDQIRSNLIAGGRSGRARRKT